MMFMLLAVLDALYAQHFLQYYNATITFSAPAAAGDTQITRAK